MNLPTVLAHQLAERPRERQWLIEELWADEAVGIVGGEPKCYKSFLALDMAVAVAGGVPCLGQFAPAATGRVLLFAAEDALHVVRQRLAGIALSAGRKLADLDIHVITAPSLRLDLQNDRDGLTGTITELQPKLLILDPFIRMHRIDENLSGDVAPLLAYLRQLQRRFHLAVVLVHHARKGGAKMRGGQALRGSSEFHAWGDSNLYLRRCGDQLTLCVEHRAAASIDAIALQLDIAGDAVALKSLERQSTGATTTASAPAPKPPTLQEQIEEHLAAADSPLTAAMIRKLCRVRNSTLTSVLAQLVAAGRIRKQPNGYATSP